MSTRLGGVVWTAILYALLVPPLSTIFGLALIKDLHVKSLAEAVFALTFPLFVLAYYVYFGLPAFLIGISDGFLNAEPGHEIALFGLTTTLSIIIMPLFMLMITRDVDLTIPAGSCGILGSTLFAVILLARRLLIRRYAR